MARGRYCYRDVLPFTAMVMVECTNVGLSTIFKAATNKGLSYHVFMVYSYAISTLILVPLAYFFHRKAPLPPFTAGLVGRFFILGCLGFTSQFLGYKGIDYSNPTLASAMSNLTPACTFVLAVFLRMEKISWRRVSSQAKIAGTTISIAGAIVVVLFKGPAILWNQSHSVSVTARLTSSATPATTAAAAAAPESTWLLGGALLAADYVMVSIWYIYQSKVVKEYPAEMVVVLFYNLFSCLIATPVCLISEPNLGAWKVKPDVRLISILYSGIVGSAFGTLVHTWGLHVKGPVYVALFRPLSIAIAAIMGVIFLGDNLYLGSIVGSFVISMGFYIVMWGKVQEETDDKSEDCTSECPNDEKVPLLKAHGNSSKEGSLAVA